MTSQLDTLRWHGFDESDPLPPFDKDIFVLLEPINTALENQPEPFIIRRTAKSGSYGSAISLFGQFGQFIDTNGSFTPVFWRLA